MSREIAIDLRHGEEYLFHEECGCFMKSRTIWLKGRLSRKPPKDELNNVWDASAA